MKKIAVILGFLTLIFIQQTALAENVIPVSNQIKNAAWQKGEFSKSYKISCENLMYLLLSAINDQNYSIEEIQFKTGSVLFKAYSKEFLANVSSQDGYNSFIKIIPVDNIYNFSPALIQKIHNYIDNNTAINFQKIL